MSNAVAQFIGFLGTGIFIASFQCKSARKLMFAQVLSCASYILHFFLIGAYAGSILEVFLILNYLVINATPKSEQSIVLWRGWKWVFSALFVVSTALTWQGFADLLPLLGSIATTISGWTRNGKKIRLARLLCVSPCWLVYDILMRSYSGILAQVIGIASIMVSICRYGWKALDQEN